MQTTNNETILPNLPPTMLATVEGMKWLVLKKESLSIQGLHDWLLRQDEALQLSASRAKQTEVALHPIFIGSHLRLKFRQ